MTLAEQLAVKSFLPVLAPYGPRTHLNQHSVDLPCARGGVKE